MALLVKNYQLVASQPLSITQENYIEMLCQGATAPIHIGWKFLGHLASLLRHLAPPAGTFLQAKDYWPKQSLIVRYIPIQGHC